MVQRRDIGSWLEGTPGGSGQRWPGERLGRPKEGPGSVARPGRRLAALLIDWLLCYLIATGLFDGNQWAILGTFAIEQMVLIATLGYSIGQRMLAMQVQKLDGGPAGPLAAVVRTVLLCLLIPAVVFDADQRGLHDRAMGTILVRI
ncbi:RDD family protein [Arthrobacter pigmenti]